MKKIEQYDLIASYLGDERTVGAIKSLSYSSPKMYELLLLGAKAKSGSLVSPKEIKKEIIDLIEKGIKA